jgi:hypothetical protein
MGNDMELLFEIFFVLFGLVFIFFHSRIASIAINSWYAMYPNKRVWKKGFDIFFLGGGIVFVIFGLAAMFGIIKLG